MHMQPTQEQRALVDAVKGAVAEILPLGRLHQAGGRDRSRLGDIAALGCLGIALDEAAGGAGATAIEEALLFGQLGRQLASPSILGSTLAAHIAAHRDPERARSIASGAEAVALAIPISGHDVLLIGADSAPDHVLALGKDGPALYRGVVATHRSLVDADQWTLPIHTAVLMPGKGAKGSGELGIRARLLCAAFLAGIAACARDMGVAHANLREQFGKPIGSFQAIKHHCADMALCSLAATDQTSFAAVALADARDDAGFQVLSALSLAIRAARFNAGTNIQIHGGTGFSDEADPHLLLKHARVWEMIAGGEEAVHAALLREASPLGSRAMLTP